MGEKNKSQQAKEDAKKDMRATGFIPPRKCPPHDDQTVYSSNWMGTQRWAEDQCKDCGRKTNLRLE